MYTCGHPMHEAAALGLVLDSVITCLSMPFWKYIFLHNKWCSVCLSHNKLWRYCQQNDHGHHGYVEYAHYDLLYIVHRCFWQWLFSMRLSLSRGVWIIAWRSCQQWWLLPCIYSWWAFPWAEQQTQSTSMKTPSLCFEALKICELLSWDGFVLNSFLSWPQKGIQHMFVASPWRDACVFYPILPMRAVGQCNVLQVIVPSKQFSLFIICSRCALSSTS